MAKVQSVTSVFRGYAAKATWQVFPAIAALFLVLAVTGCASQKVVTVEHVTHDTIRITQQQRDSIVLHDSIHVRERTQGDTVFVEVTRWHTQYRDRLLLDSIYAVRTDSVPVPYPVEKKVPRALSWFQKMEIWLGRFVLVSLAVLAVVWVAKRKTRLFQLFKR